MLITEPRTIPDSTKNIPAEFGTHNDNHNKFGFNLLNPNLLWINCVILMNQLRPLITQYTP